MKLHDEAELAIWICDEDNPAKIAWWKREEAPRLFAESAAMFGVELAPPRFYELAPGQDRAGSPPKGIQGTNVRLLVAECRVVGLRPVAAPVAFLADLELKDLERLREITKRAALPRVITDQEADQIIESFGPKVAKAVLREQISGTQH